jgi:hypothetical protein
MKQHDNSLKSSGKTIRLPTQLTLFDTGAFEPPTDLVTPDFGAINHKT